MSSRVKQNFFKAVAVEAILYNTLGLCLFLSTVLMFQGFTNHAEIKSNEFFEEVIDHNKRRLKNGDFAVRLTARIP